MKSKRRQPQRLPPPLTHGMEAIDAEAVLREFASERLALLLWKTVRAVRLWAALPATDRPRAFDESAFRARAELLEEAGVPAEVLAEFVRAGGVLQPRPRAVAVAIGCRRLADWARAQDAPGTALELMQAAALVLPRNAELAQEVGRLARAQAEYHRAETWYRQGVSRARRTREWREFTRSYLGLGNVLMLRGSYPQAGKALVRAVRAAKRFSLRPHLAAAYHELVVLGIRTDRAPEVVRYARLGTEAYGPGHRRLPALAHDVGIFLLNDGYFDAALRIFQSVPAEFGSPADRLARSAAIVRAAAVCVEPAAYREALERTEELLRDPEAAVGAAQAYVAMARGAAHVGDLDRARSAALAARTLAETRGEGELVFVAESVLASIETADAVRSSERPARARAPQPVERLVEELTGALGSPAIG